MANNQKIEKPGWLYFGFKNYLKPFHDKILYRKTYCIQSEAIQPDGIPQLIVSNHQNCLNDPLGVLFALKKRKVNFITRADVFALSPIANKFLRSIGLLPAFRLGWEGEEALGKNDETFKISEKALLDGNTVIMFPEGGHQNKRWLGYFSQGYLKLAFEAAEMGNFEKEIFILPSCNHYSNYFGIQHQYMVKFGTPISLKPYYELYKTKPRTVKREVNKLVREQIESLMLDIRDLDNYEEVYFLAHDWGYEHALQHKQDPTCLPYKLNLEKEIVARLAKAKDENEDDINRLYAQTKELMEGIKKEGIDYRTLVKVPQAGIADLWTLAPKAWVTALWALLLLVSLPLFIFSLWPSWFIYETAMQLFKKKSTDEMFEGTFLFAITMLFTLPLFGTLTLVLTWMYLGFWFGLAHVLMIPGLMLFAWRYKERFKKVMQNIRYLTKGKKMQQLRALKEEIAARMEKIMEKQ